MTIPIFIPPPIRRTQKCNRCGLLYPKKEASCIHCSNLSDSELNEIKLKISQERQANQNLGKLFLFIAFLILIGMALYLM